MRNRLVTGQLLDLLKKTTHSATQSGHLRFFQTECVRLDDPMQSEVRVLKEYRPKPNRMSSPHAYRNPFLPYEPEMYVSHLPSGHVILLNKFNVVPNHHLIVTEAHESQTSILGVKEFTAMAHTINEFPSLFFYNSGRKAGASQPHRHLQVLPLDSIPVDRLCGGAPDAPGHLSSLLFPHRIVRIDQHGFDEHFLWYQHYIHMLNQLELLGPGQAVKPYNLLMSSKWLMVIPRVHARYRSVAVNALGFAGCFLVGGEEGLAQLQKAGVEKVLQFVSGSR